MPSCAVILLAAGSSTRMGVPKQLLPYRGRPLLRHAVETALAAGCSPVVVVLGANSEAVGESLAGLDVVTTVNADWDLGMGSSIQTGLRTLQSTDADAAILALGDQPFVSAAFYRSLVAEADRSGCGIVSARYADTVGVPVYFARRNWPLLEAMAPDQGCKGVILRNGGDAKFLDCPEAAIDIDTPEEYRRLVDPRLGSRN